jgi:hypothetical protein
MKGGSVGFFLRFWLGVDQAQTAHLWPAKSFRDAPVCVQLAKVKGTKFILSFRQAGRFVIGNH